MSGKKRNLPCATYIGKEPYLFISYSHADEDRVFPEINVLYEYGFRIWYDEGINPGSEWRGEIAHAITDSVMFIVFITRSSIQSRHVMKEINFAIDENKPFLAVHLEEVLLPPGLKFSMGDVQAVMKWQIAAEDYMRKMMRVLPGACRRTTRPTLSRDVLINYAQEENPAVDELPLQSAQPDPASKDFMTMPKSEIRELTTVFLPQTPLKYPVKVFHEKIQADDAIQEGVIVFILNPVKLSQLEFKFLLRYKACFVICKNFFEAPISLEQHPLKLLLNHQDVNQHLEKIMGLHKNILELHIEEKKRWDFLGIAGSSQPLFTIHRLNFCFKEFPIIQKEILTLDEVFIRETAKSIKPMDIINMYLDIIENNADSQLEATNRRNALQKVFRFYKSDEPDYIIKLNGADLAFLVDMLRLEEQDHSTRKAIVIGALTAACSYFVHMGQPIGFQIIMEKLWFISEENGRIIKYRHISDDDLIQLKLENAFLYYHLTCRIPNQYTVALFDSFLIETDPFLQHKYETVITACLQYLKRQITELSLMPEILLWEFKRDQEIGAIAGTIGQLTLYIQANMNNDNQAFDEAEKYLKKALEYAHPAEKNRNENYLIQCGLARIVRDRSLEKTKSEMAKELTDLAGSLGRRFLNREITDAFDVMFSINIIAVANITVSSELAENLYSQMGFRWEKISQIMSVAPYQYAAFLLVSFLFFTPQKLIERIPDFEILLQKTLVFFKLTDTAYRPENMIDLIALKFLLAHAWYLSVDRAEDKLNKLEKYKVRIENAPIYAKWASDCLTFLNDCSSQTASPIKALRLIYAIPY